ncbi:MAG: lysophospholipid acyltransferase family protein [Boseongicola sp.]|nr:lysophospholipid acyltransferase family protein [Boseongicola sp.]MDE0347387.1 lysophospholipid acyltransferase family protein [Boseongicola sp.]MXW84417.1 1-acyl-sn-glycerol-3-phosphate acyltransferase [Boseongicola sp. SB0667_bin_21]
MMLQWVRSLAFSFFIYAAMFGYAIFFFPFAVVSRDWAYRACNAWCALVIGAAHQVVGLKVEIRGDPPAGDALIAAKHQSFFDIIVIFHAVHRPRFIMKRELMFAPVLGQYALRIGCIPVARGRRRDAIRSMKRRVSRQGSDMGQLIIYPQGTRVAPGAWKPYKVGTGVLYEQLGKPCVPVATNVGYFWPKRKVLRKPGTAVVEFLDPIPPGLSVTEFMETLEERVEARSGALLDEAREAS